MENRGDASSSVGESDPQQTSTTLHHLTIPPGLTGSEFGPELVESVAEFHTYLVGPGQCSSLLGQRIHAPPHAVWSVVRRFDRPQAYKHFIKSCVIKDAGAGGGGGSDDAVWTPGIGALREVNVISGLPAETSTERLDILNDRRRVTGFSIIGGEHRLKNYRSVTTVHELLLGGETETVVLESYVVEVPEGNTEEDARLFADTVVKLNLQKLASVTEGSATR